MTNKLILKNSEDITPLAKIDLNRKDFNVLSKLDKNLARQFYAQADSIVQLDDTTLIYWSDRTICITTALDNSYTLKLEPKRHVMTYLKYWDEKERFLWIRVNGDNITTPRQITFATIQ